MKLYKTSGGNGVKGTTTGKSDLDATRSEGSASGYTDLGSNTLGQYALSSNPGASESADLSRYGVDGGEIQSSLSQTFSESLAKSEGPNLDAVRAEEDAAVAAYRAHLQLQFRAARDARHAEEATGDVGTTETDTPMSYGAAFDGDLDEDMAPSFSQSVSLTQSEDTPAFLDVTTQDAVKWYRETNDPIWQAQKKNSLMGWEKGKDGKWADTGGGSSIRQTPKAMLDHYKGEEKDASSFRGLNWGGLTDTKNAVVKGVNTRYLGQDEQARAQVGMQGGKLVGADGKNVDTQSASGTGTFGNSGQGRFIYAKGADGEIRAIDPWAEHREHQRDDWLSKGKGQDAAPSKHRRGHVSKLIGMFENMGRDPREIQLEFANHSSLVAGGDVRAAGEMIVEDGEVKLVNDASGHYKPDNAMTYDMVAGLVEGGAAPERMGVGLTKKQGRTSAKASVTSGDMVAGALEFLSYGGASDAEERMRGARDERKPMMEEIAQFDRSRLKKTGSEG